MVTALYSRSNLAYNPLTKASAVAGGVNTLRLELRTAVQLIKKKSVDW